MKKRKIEREDKKIERTKNIAIKEGSAYSLMDGFGLRFITPYALALGASNFQIGILSSLPTLIGHLVQLPFLKSMEKYSRKTIVFLGVLLQALFWIPLILIGFLYFYHGLSAKSAVIYLIISYTFMVIFGSIASPFWNSWMKDIIIKDIGSYFGKRNRVMGIAAILSMLIAGLILNYFGKNAFYGFLIIFTIAFFGRIFSSFLITKQYEPKFEFNDGYYFTFFSFIKRMLSNNFGRFVLFASLISFATAIASPFFAVYMLENLNFSYFYFTIVILSAPIGHILFMPFWGKFSDKYGNVEAIRITGTLIPLVPFLWVITILFNNSNTVFILPYLLVVEMISGFAWSGFNLALGDFVYDAVSRQRIAICFSYFNILNSSGIFLGAILGGLFASGFSPTFGMNAIIFVFILSAILRFLFVMIFTPMIKEVRPVKKFEFKDHMPFIHHLYINGFRFMRLHPFSE